MDQDDLKLSTLREQIIANINSDMPQSKKKGTPVKKGKTTAVKAKRSKKRTPPEVEQVEEEEQLYVIDDSQQASTPSQSQQEELAAVSSDEDETPQETDSTVVSDTQGSQASSKKAKQKGKKRILDIDSDEEDALIEWVHTNDMIYDKSNNDYKDTILKTNLWDEKAASMSEITPDGRTRKKIAGKALCRWWRNMRSRFNRSKNLIMEATSSGAAADSVNLTQREDWIYRRLHFLMSHTKRNRPKSSLSKMSCALKAAKKAADDLGVKISGLDGTPNEVSSPGLSQITPDPLEAASTAGGQGTSRSSSRARDAATPLQEHLILQAGHVQALHRNVQTVISRANEPGNEWVALGNMVATTGAKMDGILSVDFYEQVQEMCLTYRRQLAARNDVQLPPMQGPAPPRPPPAAAAQVFQVTQNQPVQPGTPGYQNILYGQPGIANIRPATMQEVQSYGYPQPRNQPLLQHTTRASESTLNPKFFGEFAATQSQQNQQ